MPKKVSNPTCSCVSEVLLVNLYMRIKSLPELIVELCMVAQTVAEQDVKMQPLWHEDNGQGHRNHGGDRQQGYDR